MKKVRDLDRMNYMKLVKETPDSLNYFVPMEWEKRLDQYGLLSLLFMPHFDGSTEANAFVQHFLVVFHGRYMWLDKAYLVDVDLISLITSLPRVGIDPTPYLRKEKDIVMITRVKDKYELVRANKGFLISSINNTIVRFTAKILSCKML